MVSKTNRRKTRPSVLTELIRRSDLFEFDLVWVLFFRLMQLAAGAPPITYRQLVVNPKPQRLKPTAPSGPRPVPAASLPAAGRPWRQTADLGLWLSRGSEMDSPFCLFFSIFTARWRVAEPLWSFFLKNLVLARRNVKT